MRTLNIIHFQDHAPFAAMLLAAVLFAGCAGKPSVDVEGTFANFSRSEFSEAYDTLEVKKSNGNSYLIHRSTGIVLLDQPQKRGTKILERQVWKAELDIRSGLLIEQRKGLKILVDDDSLTLERAVYRRVQ